MTKKIASTLFKKPATSKYPFVKPSLPENYRGEPIFDTDLCIGCGLCCLNCPAKAIDMVEVEGKKYPQLRLDKCIFCGTCTEVCPKKAIKTSETFELATTDKSSLVLRPKVADKKTPE